MSDNEQASKVWRVIAIALLAVATLGFGMAGLCGAAFTLMSLPDVLSNRSGSYAGAALIISVPSLLIGGGLAWACGRGLYKFLKRRQA
ncbi:MAG TPA: hypothetical protein VGE36_04205 [Roseateles sp.]